MKLTVVLLAVALCGTNALGFPTLAWINSTAQKAIDTTHKVNGQVIVLVNSTNQDAAEYIKDASQTSTLWLEDGYDKIGDKTKDAIQIAQDKANQLLDIVAQFGGPLQVGANLGSKVTDMVAGAGNTMTNVGIGGAQLVTAEANHAIGAALDKMAQVSSGVAGAATAANDVMANLASGGVNKIAKATFVVGGGFGKAIQALGKGVSSWSSGSS